MSSQTTVKVTTRSGNIVHLGFMPSPNHYFSMCGQSGKFSKSYSGEINCEKCLSGQGQGHK